MPDPTPTAPPPAAPAAPAAPVPTTPPSQGTDIAARMRAAAGLPPKDAAPPKAAPSAAAPPAGTPPAPTTGEPPPADKPDDKPPEPKKSEGQLALELVREQRARQAAEKKAAELEQRLKTGETESAPVKTAREKWQAGKFADAIREAFGVKNFSDDFLVQLAQADGEPEQLTPEQIREQVRAEIKAEEDARVAQVVQLREAAAAEVGETLTKSPDRWPTVWRFGVSGERIAAAMDASFDPRTGRTASPDQIFDQLEKEYRAHVEELPYWKRDPGAGEPPPAPPPPAAPRSFGAESRRGPVPTAEPTPPQTAEQRWEARRKAEAEWRAKTFAAPRN
jgi:hypothetical protein